MTYAERELSPLGFSMVESTKQKLVLSFGHLKLQFDCSCPAYPDVKALGCPLHHSGPGSSWSVDEAKRYATKAEEKDVLSHGCGFCGTDFLTVQALYIHQQEVHDPDGIMFSELGLPK